MMKQYGNDIVHTDERIWRRDGDNTKSACDVMGRHVAGVTPLFNPLVTARPDCIVFYVITRSCVVKHYLIVMELTNLNKQCVFITFRV